jgi:hypothetical protein
MADKDAVVGQMLEGIEPEVGILLADLRADDIVLPNDYVPFPWAARRLFERLAIRREAFVRDGVVLELRGNQLDVMTGAKLRSRIDGYGRRVRAVKAVKHGVVLASKRCSADTAEALLVTREAAECLPAIEMVSTEPVLVERDGQLITLGHGYHADGGGTLVLGNREPEAVGLADAVAALLALVEEFKFATPADKSRAVAGFVGPAIRAGALLPGHALINCIEADQSQAGKGYLVRLQHAVYGEHPVPIAKRNGGVGSLDEDIGAQLLRAKMFIVIDNVRGKLDSQCLEMMMTTDDEVQVRVPYRAQVTVSVRRMNFAITSNGLDATRDLTNRFLIVRLVKHRPANGFREFSEGGLLEHVRARQPFYLGCVHAVVREWHARGKKQLKTEHSFREWVGALDWIVQELFSLRPLLEGHADAVKRAGSPALGWLRSVALTVLKLRKEGRVFSAMDLAQVCVDEGIGMPGFSQMATDEDRRKSVGLLLKKCFDEAGQCNQLMSDSIHIKRWERPDPERPEKYIRRYQFWRGDQVPPPPDDWEEIDA